MQLEILKLINHPELIKEALHTDELEVLIKERTGLAPEMTYSVTRHWRGWDEYFFQPEAALDLKRDCGIFARVLQDCKLETCGSSISYSEDDGYKAWFRLCLGYNHFEGGANSMLIAAFAYENGHWAAGHYKKG